VREPLLDVKEVSGLLSVHPKTIYAWKASGIIPSFTLNGRVRFDKKQIDEFIERHRVHFIDPEALSQRVSLSLDSYDKLHLRGGKSAVRKNARRWNYGFGTVYLRKTKRGESWYLDYRNRHGERIREVAKGATARGEALIVLQEKAGENLSGKSPALRKYRSMKFSELATIYIEDHAKIKKRSWKTDDYMIKRSVNPFFGEKLISEITPLEIERWIRWRLEQGVTKITVNRGLQVLKKMFNIAIGEGFTTDNPVRKVRMFSEKDNIKERILTEEEEPRLIEACVDYLRPVVITALHTGMRRGEILALEWARVDMEKRTIKVTHTKTDRPRYIEINATLLEVLRRQRIANPTGELVFPSPSTGLQMVGVRKAFVRACKAAGIEGLRFHDLRHTFASRLVEKGVDIITVKELLGHSTIILTQRYTHSRNEQRRRAVEKLDAQPAAFLSHFCHMEKGKTPVNPYVCMN
jgi:integrase/predicted DNA-binding transcriptional regulator AlpA